ncbi:TonB-dependent receptor [Flavobacterium ajazii]|uniref:TonB-dependent receptor n=1 Tax=Flavobacterium ajazii TaxID=2692318 RepID=UPI0013D8B09C|nr:TonB-dependent receptor [Flavobacterium ajazii]
MQINRLFLLLLILFSAQGFSQNSKVLLKGVVSGNNGQPLEGVSVALKGTAYSALTNEEGKYEISAVPGNYTLLISYVGFKSKQTKINLQSNQTAPGITIEEDMAALDEVQVTGKSKIQRIKEEPFNITAVDLKKLYNTSADMNQVLNRTTGVRVRENGGMGSTFTFSLNGFSGSQIKFFLDGIPIDNYGSSFTLNNFPVTMAERIEVYKGVVPIELGGDALGGAVNIVSNKNTKRYIDASYSYGSFNTHKAAINSQFTSNNGFVTNINAFFNYSDNSYKVDARIPDAFSGTFGPWQKLKHFHDGYKSGAIMAEAGVKNKKYADYLLFGLTASANKKEIQQGTTMFRVVGDAFTDSHNFVPSLKFKKTDFFIKDLTASLAASYNIAQERSVDTSSARYDWSGNYTIKNYETSGGEINDQKTLMVFDVKSLQSNANLKYDLNEKNSFAFNYTYLGYKRSQDNERDPDYIVTKPFVNKNILGFAYNLSALEKRFSYTAFTKMYDLKGEIRTYYQYQENEVIKPSFNDFGYGTAGAYFVIPEQLQIKASYEHAFRLPAAVELLGDGGIRVNPNPYLEPEESDNVNLGVSFKQSKVKHSFGIEGNLLYRNAKNFIQSRIDGNKSIYVNFKNVAVYGVDGVVHYGFKDWLTFDLNATYQKTLNKDNSLQPGTDQVNYLYNKQVQNVPILYGNADLGFHFRNIKYKTDNFSVNVSTNYTDSYYLNPPSLGGQNKKEIPEQLYFSLNLAYSLQNGKYNVAFECFDINDEKLYDYFNVQKPGRSFTLKLRYVLN